MTETPDRTQWLALLGLTVAGVLLGAGLRASESRAHASSLECEDTGEREGKFVEIRRIEGNGAIADQEYWRTYANLSLKDYTLRVYDAVSDPAHPPFELELAPEAP